MGQHLWEKFIEDHGEKKLIIWLQMFGIEGLIIRYTNWLVDMQKLDENDLTA